MPTVTFRGRAVTLDEGETVLDALLRAGEQVAHSCRAGACGACLLEATSGEVDPAAQQGMRAPWRARGLFYACQCRPRGDLEVAPPGDGVVAPAAVVERAMLSASVARVVVRAHAPFEALPGQYVTLHRDGVARSYSVASRPDDASLELHVRRQPGGRMSPWLCDDAREGDAVSVQGPMGDCVYTPGRPAQPLLLAGTGTGLAPLWGVLHEALRAGHAGDIWLFHGAVAPEGLYLVEALRAVPGLRYVPCVLEGEAPGVTRGALGDVVLAHVPKAAGMRVCLAGSPDVVQPLRKRIYLAGASLRDITCDAFVSAPR